MDTYLAMEHVPDGVFEKRSIGNDRQFLEDIEGLVDTTDSGVEVTPRTSLEIAAVSQAVQIISGNIAKLTCQLMRRDQGERTGAAQYDDPLYDLVALAPNEYTTAVQFWRQFMVHALLWNRAYAVIFRNGVDQPYKIGLLMPDRTRLAVVNDEQMLMGLGSEVAAMFGRGQLLVVTEVDGQILPIPYRDVITIGGIDVDRVMPYQTWQAAKDSFGLTIAAERYSSKFFANGASSGGILELPYGMPKPAVDNLVEGFYKAHRGLDSAFKVVILRDGAKYHQTTVKPTDAQLSELRSEQIREVARWFNLPPYMLGDQESSSSYSSLEQKKRDFLDSTLAIWLRSIEQECTSKLLSSRRKSNGYYFRYDTRKMVEPDQKELATVVTQLVSSGILSPNEGRAWIGLDNRPDGEGDQFFFSNNMTPDRTAEANEPEVPEDNNDQTEGRHLLTCQNCGIEFRAKTLRSKFCSTRCRVENFRKNKENQQ